MSADTLLTLEDVAKQLQVSREQVVELVKKNLLRGFRDQKTYKFKPADVDAYRKKLTSSATTMGMEATEVNPPVKHDTSKIDLAEIDADSGIEDADQTSVLAPPDEHDEHAAKAEETPVFQFSEKDLGLEEDSPAPEDADQTSLLAPAEESEENIKKEKDTKPAIDFAEKDLNLSLDDEKGEGDSVLVADESESSVDILEVADESSGSDSGSSASNVAAEEESSSGEEVKAVSDVEESPKPMAPVAPLDKSDKTVTDILGVAEEGSEDELQDLDLDKVVESGDTILAAEPGSEDSAAVPLADETDTVQVADEAATVGIAGEDAAEAVAEAPKTAPVEGETAAVSDAVAEALRAAEGEPEAAEVIGEEAIAEAEAAAEPAPGQMAPVGWEKVEPSAAFNAAMVAALVVLLAGSAFLIAEMTRYEGGFTVKVIEIVKKIPIFAS